MSEESATWRSLLDARYWPQVVLLSLALWLHATNTMLTSTTLPSVVADIGGHRLLSWAFSLYLIGSVVSGTHMSLLVKRLGLRRTIIAAAFVYFMGCVLCAIAYNMPLFLFGRVVQGLGGGGLVALVYLSQHQFFPNNLIPRIIASNSVVWMAAAFSGPLIGGSFATYGMWRMAFLFFAVQALFFIWFASKKLKNKHNTTLEHTHRVSAINILILSASIVFVAMAGNQSSGLMAVLLVCLGIASLFVFIQLDSRAGLGRMLPQHMLNIRNPVSSGLLMTLVYSAALMSFVVYGPVVLNNVYGLSPLATGFVLITESLAWSASAIIFAGKKQNAERRLILAGSAFVSLGICLQGVVVPNTNIALIVFVLVIACAGFGAFWGYLIRKVVDHADVQDHDRASSMLPVTQQIGFALGAAYAGLVANGLGYSAQSSVQDIQHIATGFFFAFIPFAIIGNIAAWFFVNGEKVTKPIQSGAT